MKIKNVLKHFGFILLSTMFVLMCSCSEQDDSEPNRILEYNVQNNAPDHILVSREKKSNNFDVISDGKAGSVEFTVDKRINFDLWIIYEHVFTDGDTYPFKSDYVDVLYSDRPNEKSYTSEGVDIAIIEGNTIVFEFKELTGSVPPPDFYVEFQATLSIGWFNIKWDVD